MVTFRIDIEPKGWARGTPWRGRVLTTKEQRAYQARLKCEAQIAMNGQPMMEGPIHFHLTAFVPMPAKIPAARRGCPTTKPDADNILKNCLDAFNGILWKDDVQVVEATVLKKYSSSPALVVVARAA